MKCIIAGSRKGIAYYVTHRAIEVSEFNITEVVSGGAAGPDKHGEEWAEKNGIPVKSFIPDWNRHGKSAGMLRNQDMAEYADALIAIWDGKSRGTKNMIEEAKSRGLMTFVCTLEQGRYKYSWCC